MTVTEATDEPNCRCLAEGQPVTELGVMHKHDCEWLKWFRVPGCMADDPPIEWLTDDDWESPSTCEYYRGVGKCSIPRMGCSWAGEPRCMTDEPREGWDAPPIERPDDE
jgi:hypothetical protein